MKLDVIVDLSNEELAKELETTEHTIIDGILEILKSYDIMKQGEDFRCMEEIVCLIENNGYDCGVCHDF